MPLALNAGKPKELPPFNLAKKKRQKDYASHISQSIRSRSDAERRSADLAVYSGFLVPFEVRIASQPPCVANPKYLESIWLPLGIYQYGKNRSNFKTRNFPVAISWDGVRYNCIIQFR